ncbi:hypothetical protein HQ529_02300 [Candidatus Woesearchaeota archaeon]|nr:hypothetical protein [Candidatus Woesearchaeota archaeon]
MIITAKTILGLNKKYNIIENLCERELNPEGVGFDIRVGEIYKLTSKGYLGVDNRNTPNIEKIADISDGDKKVVLAPGEFILVKTIEKVNLPSKKININHEPCYLMMDVYPRSTLQRCGVYFKGTKTDPGYHGELTFSLKNVSEFPFELELGARIANVVFKEVYGELSRAYGGQWKGGRVATEKVEKQI